MSIRIVSAGGGRIGAGWDPSTRSAYTNAMVILIAVTVLAAVLLAARWWTTPYRPGTVALPFPPPLPALLAIALGGVCELVWPTTWAPGPVATILGAALVALSLAVIGAAGIAFRSGGVSPNPGRVVPVVLERGIFRLSRNPMYVGFLLLAIGSGVWADSIWIAALAVPAWAVLHFQIVVREEAYLAGLFPEAYGAYRARVRRWL